MNFLCVLAFTLHVLVVSNHGGASKRRTGTRRTFLVPRILSLEHCQDERRHSLLVHNFTTIGDGQGVVFVTTFIEFQRALLSATMMKVVLSKCREAVSSNTCEYFATWPFRGNLCGMVRAKGMMWSSFMRAFQPDLECPISKGLYKVENATIDVSLGETIAHIDIAGNVWTVEVTITDEQEKLWSCLNTAVLINRVNIKE